MALPYDQWDDLDPDETDFRFINWAAELDDADVITQSTWALDPSNVDTNLEILVAPAPGMSGQNTFVWLSGGTIGVKYKVTNTITVDNGRVLQQTGKVKVKAR